MDLTKQKTITTLPYKHTLPLYAVRFEERGEADKEEIAEYGAEYANFYSDMIFHELHTLVNGAMPRGVGGMDFMECSLYELFEQEMVDAGDPAYAVICTYDEVEYTFGSSIGMKQIVAICKTEARAHEWRSLLYNVENNHLNPKSNFPTVRGLPGFGGDRKFDVLALNVVHHSI